MSKYKTNWQLDEKVLPEDMNRIEENIKENSNTFTEFKKEYDINSTQKDESIKLKAAKEEVVLKVEPPKNRDCNSFRGVNVFCVFDTGAGDFKNTPEGTLAYGSSRVFLLINRGLNTNRIQQEFINLFPENNITRWVRNYNGDGVVKWGNWYKVYDGANKPTLQELGAKANEPTTFSLHQNYVAVRTPLRKVGQYYEFWDNELGWADIHCGNLLVKGTQKVYHEGFKPTTDDIRAWNKVAKRLEGVDLNTVTEGGIYATVRNSTTTNAPVSSDGRLIVMSWSSGNWASQMFFADGGRIFTRTATNIQGTAWTNWTELYTKQSKPTLSDIGAASANHNHDERYFARRNEINRETDWNTLINQGCYKVQLTSWGDTNKNGPNQGYSYGLLMVYRSEIESENRIYQEYLPHKIDEPRWFRMCNSGVWHEWQPIDVRKSADLRYLGKNAKAVDSDKLRGWLLAERNTNYVGIPFVANDGVMELGKFLDFHIPGSDTDYDARIEAIKGCLKFWQDVSGLNLWARKYLRINDWYGGTQDGRMYYKESDKGLYTENVEELFVQGGAVARGKNERIGNADIYHIGGGIRLVRQVITTGASNSGGGVSYTIHFPKAWGWVQPLSLVSHNMNNASANTSGYCTIDTWSTTYLNGGCYNMVAGKPTQIILTYLAGE